MKRFCFLVMFIIAIASVLSSCNPRQQRIVEKIAQNVDRMAEKHSQSSEDVVIEVVAKYEITGIVHYDTGGVVNIDPQYAPILCQEGSRLYLQMGFKSYEAYRNNMKIITETYYLPDRNDGLYSFGETSTRTRNVSNFSYMCPTSNRTYYFNAGPRIE